MPWPKGFSFFTFMAPRGVVVKDVLNATYWRHCWDRVRRHGHIRVALEPEGSTETEIAYGPPEYVTLVVLRTEEDRPERPGAVVVSVIARDKAEID